MQRVSTWMLLISLSLLAGGCGQTGDLYLPEPEPEPETAPQGEAAAEEEKKT